MNEKELKELVNRTAKEFVDRLDPKDRERFQVSIPKVEKEDNERYQYYLKLLRQITEKEIRGKPDNFIEAACMCGAIIKYKIVSFNIIKLSKERPIIVELAFINYAIALEVALAMMKEISIYEERGGEWIEIRSSTDRNIVVPKGIIPNAPLKSRIIHNLAYDDLGYIAEFNPMQFSDTLHLIYLCNQ